MTYFPLFGKIAEVGNPKLIQAHETIKVVVKADPATCGSVFDPVNIRVFTEPCDIARRALAAAGIKYTQTAAGAGEPTVINMNGKDIAVEKGDKTLAGKVTAAAVEAGYPKVGDATILKTTSLSDLLNSERALHLTGLLFVLVLYVTMVYGPIAAQLVELFPTRIRYSGMSLPYHIGNGWFGGFLPPTAFAIAASTGDIFSGLWYPIIVALGTFVIGLIFMPETKDRDIFASR